MGLDVVDGLVRAWTDGPDNDWGEEEQLGTTGRCGLVGLVNGRRAGPGSKVGASVGDVRK